MFVLGCIHTIIGCTALYTLHNECSRQRSVYEIGGGFVHSLQMAIVFSITGHFVCLSLAMLLIFACVMKSSPFHSLNVLPSSNCYFSITENNKVNEMNVPHTWRNLSLQAVEHRTFKDSSITSHIYRQRSSNKNNNNNDDDADSMTPFRIWMIFTFNLILLSVFLSLVYCIHKISFRRFLFARDTRTILPMDVEWLMSCKRILQLAEWFFSLYTRMTLARTRDAIEYFSHFPKIANGHKCYATMQTHRNPIQWSSQK